MIPPGWESIPGLLKRFTDTGSDFHNRYRKISRYVRAREGVGSLGCGMGGRICTVSFHFFALIKGQLNEMVFYRLNLSRMGV